MRVAVVFCDSTGHPLRHFLKKGFRHCFVVVETASGNWVLIDGADGRPYISILGTSRFDPVKFYENSDCLVVMTEQSDTDPRLPIAVANCVGLVKAVLAIDAPLTQTPYALYRLLERRARSAP